MYGCQQLLLNPAQELTAVLEFICTEANNLMNCGIFYARQVWFKCRRTIGKYDLEKEYKNNKHFQALYSQADQQALRTGDVVNQPARVVINHCLQHRIGTVVFGWNRHNKNGIELGKKTNQEFVQIPTARLKNRIEQLCEQYGIQFVETEESYTSKASFQRQRFSTCIRLSPGRVEG